MAQHQPWRDWQELSVILRGIPNTCTTYQIYDLLVRNGATPARIELFGKYPGQAKVIFRPPPANATYWINRGLHDNAQNLHILCRAEAEKHPHKISRQMGQPEEISINGLGISFGIMKDKDTMLRMRSIGFPEQPQPRLLINTFKQHLELHFSLVTESKGQNYRRDFIFRIPFTQLHTIKEDRRVDGSTSFLISPDAPPLAFRKTGRVMQTHNPKVNIWDERQTWYRQVSIDADPASAASRQTKLQNHDSIVDIGRWLTYRFVCDPITPNRLLEQLRASLSRHNIRTEPKSIQYIDENASSHWRWLGSAADSKDEDISALISQLSGESVHFPFELRYQLEACISHGCFHESNLSVEWAKRLLDVDKSLFSQVELEQLEEINRQDKGTEKKEPGLTYKPAENPYPRATKLLEKVLESKRRFNNPMDIFALRAQVSLVAKKIPRYCTMVRSATITPTTVYFNNPSMDTSNRVIRRYRHYEDRFLRVKFRDESYKGKIMSFDDDTNDELFTRVKRTMANGIIVGDRYYEFLAYGNSQFREHGAYFFAPTNDLTADMIREWMGNFEDIRVVAKYASRLGQCFTTTRAVPNNITIERIPDIMRNGFCFSDGVGKISPFLAQMTAHEMQLSYTNNYPSVFQFRLGGLKGVLAVDPQLKGSVIEVRPSQEKFPAVSRGLEICRVAKFATAYLNQQIVLLLSGLGVPDEVFLKMLRSMLKDFEKAMTDQPVALELMTKHVDLNHMTLELSAMIFDGFMAVEDPFFMSCLRLWRSWSIKFLKEKAKILVEGGAFLLGCVDETGTLKGHSDAVPSSDTTQNLAYLPEIFLQIPDPKAKGTYRVVEGVCTLARNPSLHPGDSRVVMAVNVPQLKHLRDCVVLPSTGDRDLSGMCSGGDLDGDDYLIIWDPDLIPTEWNHEPMDYTPPPPAISDGPVTVNHMTSFFVNHMKFDTLGTIATSHRYWADREEDGVKHENCIALASLHSMAVDYAKTGVPAVMPKELKSTRSPHWAERKSGQQYHSNKVLGKMYDEVERVPFLPAWRLPFDDRILNAYTLDPETLSAASKVKTEYDAAIRRLMTQYGISTEFEMWTTFIMSHNGESNDFKVFEVLGETISGLKHQYQELCYTTAGTNAQERDWEKLKLFVAAMYTVTAREMAAANAECEEKKLVAGQYVPKRNRDVSSMPFMSFPWLFQRELGKIAGGEGALSAAIDLPTIHKTKKRAAQAPLIIPETNPTPLRAVSLNPTAPDAFTDEGAAVLPVGVELQLGRAEINALPDVEEPEVEETVDFGASETLAKLNKWCS